ncbi:DUF6915 family protein, partial [candidate division CSSED10-310 bacterium]
MPKLEDHCQESLKLFGESFEDMHRWFDEFAGTEQYGMRHRRVRHHEAGIKEAIRLFVSSDNYNWRLTTIIIEVF